MNRLNTLAPDKLTPEQKAISEQVTRITGNPVRGPFGVWLEIPHIGGPAVEMFEGFRSRGIVERRLSELMILIVARHFSAEFAWVTHEKHGVNLGLSAEAVDAIRMKQKPVLSREDEKLVYDVTVEMLAAHKLSDALYERALSAMGRPWLLELVAGIGFYVMVGLTLNAVEMPAPGGRKPFD